MKKYPFRYAGAILVLLIIVVLLSVGGLVFNVFSLITFIRADTGKAFSYSVMVAVNLALTVFSVALLFNGKYVFKNGYLRCVFGLIPVRIKVAQITEIAHFKKSDKLVIYYGEDKYGVIVISPDRYDEFIEELRGINPSVRYESRIDGEDTPE